MGMKMILWMAAALFCSVARGELPLANFQWARSRSGAAWLSQPPAAASGTASTPRRRIPSVQELPSAAANATRVLLPLVPLVAELPALTAHTRAAWPWVRATVATAAAAVFSRRPLAFAAPLTPYWSRRQQQVQQHTATPIYQVYRRCGSRRRRQRGSHAHRFPVTVSIAADALSCSPAFGGDYSDYSGDSDNGGRCSEDGSPRHPVSSRAIRFTSPIPSAPTPQRSHSNDAAPPLTRLGAIQEAVGVASRWAAGAVAVGSALVGSGPAAVYADGAGGEREATEGGGEDGERFGSKAFTKKSYDGFADGYDDLDGGWAASAIGTEELRAQLLERATGRVLEVGVGTGLNLRHYRRDSVSAIEAVDLSPGMLRQASSRVESLGMKGLVKLSAMDVEHLEFPPKTFDTVVDTFSLCVFSDPSAALREMARVCKPGGRVLLLENSKSDFGPLATYQDLTASYLADRGGAKGCFWNQDVEALCRGAGLTVVRSSPALPGGLFRTLECVPARET